MQSKDDELKTQVSDSSLRELNSRLVIEIDTLRREKDSLISKNTELLARIVELEQSIKEDAENTKLRDAELNTRIFELERSAKENEELRNRVAKLEQHQYIDTNTISLDDETNSNDTSEQIISCNEESNTLNSDIYQDSATTTSPAETISFASQSNLRRLEEKVENEFWDQELLSTPENTIPKISISPNKNASIHKAEKSLLNKDLNIQDTKLSSSESKSLSNPIPDRQILENTLDGDDSTPGSALQLVNEQAECQKVISVKNLHAQTTKPSCSNDISNIDVSISSNLYPENENEVSASPIFSSNPAHSHAYFRNKTLEQYPNLYQEGSDGNDDYYGITDESLCPLCKLDHDDDNGIEEICNHIKQDMNTHLKVRLFKGDSTNHKTLTPEYLEWEAKLTELPSILTDKIRSRLYKRYKNKTGLDPWINFEASKSSQIEEDADNCISQDCIIKISKFPEEKNTIHEAVHKRFPFLIYTNSNAWHRDVFKYTNSEAKCPVCKEVHTHRGIWGDWSCFGKNDHYFLNCPFRIDQKKVIIAVQSLPEIQIR
ncbi:14656_t:CDS:2, partial [Entrophospora sp. SA101]